jgi:hypothetical protein
MRPQSTSFLAKTWEVKFKTLPSDQGLDEHAHAINVMFALADTSRRDGENQRINAGRMLITVQALVLTQLGPGQWDAWCRKHIDRSRADIYKVMKLAAADDPHLAHQAETEAKRVARIVAKADKVSPGRLHQELQQSDDTDGQKVVPIRRNTSTPPAMLTDADDEIEAAVNAMLTALDAFNFTFNQRFQAVRRLDARIRRKEPSDARA